MLQVSFDLLIFRAESRKDKNMKLGRQLELTGIRGTFVHYPARLGSLRLVWKVNLRVEYLTRYA
jgi:hypothetical protein